MTISEKINFLQSNHFSEYIDTYRKTEDELSNKQAMFCVCRQLATGFHESRCKRFQNKVKSETVRKLKHLLK